MKLVCKTAIFLCLCLFAKISFSIPMGYVNLIACAPSNHMVVAACVDDILYVTLDGGRKWTPKPLIKKSLKTYEKKIINTDQDESIINPSITEAITRNKANLAFNDNVNNQSDIRQKKNKAAYLAVGDDGKLVYYRKENIYFNNGGFGFSSFKSGQINGLLIDPTDGIWVATKEKLVLLTEKNLRLQKVRSWAVRCTSRPVWSANKSAVIVPGKRGLWKIQLLSDGTTYESEIINKGYYSAIGQPGAGMAVTNGRLIKFSGGEKIDAGSIPFKVLEILSDKTGNIYLKTGDNEYFSGKENIWRKTMMTSCAIDAKNNLWVGTSAGILVPFAKYLSQDKRKSALLMALSTFAPYPAPPACPFGYSSWLPSLRLMAKIESGSSAYGNNIYPYEQSGKNTSWFVGLNLSWKLVPSEDVKCAEQTIKYYKMMDLRAAKKLMLVK